MLHIYVHLHTLPNNGLEFLSNLRLGMCYTYSKLLDHWLYSTFVFRL